LFADAAHVTREVDCGIETNSYMLPGIITTDLRLNEPRYASWPNIIKAKSKPLRAEDCDGLRGRRGSALYHAEGFRADKARGRCQGRRCRRAGQQTKSIGVAKESINEKGIT